MGLRRSITPSSGSGVTSIERNPREGESDRRRMPAQHGLRGLQSLRLTPLLGSAPLDLTRRECNAQGGVLLTPFLVHYKREFSSF